MPVLGPEGKIQARVVQYARTEYPERLEARKFQAGRFGSNGWPDYDFLTEGGDIFFIEFKAPGKDLTPLQEERVKRLRKLGHRVYVVDNVDVGKEVIDTEMR